MRDRQDFWTHRRAAVKAEEEAQARLDAAQTVDARAGGDDSEMLSELHLPDPAQMRWGDDFAAFMAQEVPEHLRRRALRALWRSNPVLACVDGLNEYDDDYRAAMLAAEPIRTAYRVGKGMLSHIEETTRKAEVSIQESGSDEPEQQVIAQEDEASVETFVPPNAAYVSDASIEEPARATDEHAPADRAPKMRFRFAAEGTA